MKRIITQTKKYHHTPITKSELPISKIKLKNNVRKYADTLKFLSFREVLVMFLFCCRYKYVFFKFKIYFSCILILF